MVYLPPCMIKYAVRCPARVFQIMVRAACLCPTQVISHKCSHCVTETAPQGKLVVGKQPSVDFNIKQVMALNFPDK